MSSQNYKYKASFVVGHKPDGKPILQKASHILCKMTKQNPGVQIEHRGLLLYYCITFQSTRSAAGLLRAAHG